MKNTKYILIALIFLAYNAAAYDYSLTMAMWGNATYCDYDNTGEPHYDIGSDVCCFLIPSAGIVNLTLDFYSDGSHTTDVNYYNCSTGCASMVLNGGSWGLSADRRQTTMTISTNTGLFCVDQATIYPETSYITTISPDYSTYRNFTAGVDYGFPIPRFNRHIGIIYDGEIVADQSITNMANFAILNFTAPTPSESGLTSFTIYAYNNSDPADDSETSAILYLSTCSNINFTGISPSSPFSATKNALTNFTGLVNNGASIINTIWRVNGEDTHYTGYMPTFSYNFTFAGAIEVQVIYETGCGTYEIYTWTGTCSNPLSAYGYVYSENEDLTRNYISGAHVSYLNRYDNSTHNTITDNNGYYELNSISSGEYNITAWHDDYNLTSMLKNITYNYSSRYRTDIKLNPLYSYTAYYFNVQEITNSVYGYVEPLNNYTLKVYDRYGTQLYFFSNGTSQSASSKITYIYHDGNEIALMLDRYEQYTFNFSKAGFQCWRENEDQCSFTEIVQYESVISVALINKSNLISSLNISLNITNNKNNSVIAGASVAMYVYGTNALYNASATNDAGMTYFYNIPEGLYYFKISAAGYLSLTTEPKTINYNYSLNYKLTPIVEDYKIYGEITACYVEGTITNTSLSGVNLTFTYGNFTYSGITDERGIYTTYVKKQDSPYYLTASKKGYDTFIDQEFYANTGKERYFEFCLIKNEAYKLITFTTKYGNGSFIKDVIIDVYDENGGIIDTGLTNYYGVLTFSLQTGRYSFEAHKDGFYKEIIPADRAYDYINSDRAYSVIMTERGILDDLKDLGIPTNEKEFNNFMSGFGIVILFGMVVITAISSSVIMIKRML